MIQLIIWLASCFYVCPDPTHTIEDHGTCTLEHVTHTVPDTGGETGNGPRPPHLPPPPPPVAGD